MRTQAEKAAAFRALHERPGAFIIPNPWDAGTARLLAASGFEALATTSLGLANMLGRADSAVSRAEVIANCRVIAEATDLPVNADLENCFAHEPEAAAETIRLAAEAGMVGGSIEDYSGDRTKPIYDFDLAVARVRAAAQVAHGLPVPLSAHCAGREPDSWTRRHGRYHSPPAGFRGGRRGCAAMRRDFAISTKCATSCAR